MIPSSKFRAHTDREYKISNGNQHKMEYECEYYINEDDLKRPVTIWCEFIDFFPLFGYEKIYGPGGFEQSKDLILDQKDLDVFSSIPTVVHDSFKFKSEHLPDSSDKKDLQIFNEKIREEIEEFMPNIVGDGFCLSHEEIMELDEKD